MKKWLQLLDKPDELRILFLAQYAPSPPDYLPRPLHDDGGYPSYHANVCRSLRGLGFRVFSSSSPSVLLTMNGSVDYVYSLYNRMPIRNSEVFISSVCEFLRVPYLGSSPATRAVAEDKHLFKLACESLGISVPPARLYPLGSNLEQPPPFSAPYFIKDRTGAGSEGISRLNLVTEWADAKAVIAALHDSGRDALVESYIDGIDVTVPVIAAKPFKVLQPIHPKSDEPGSILTHDLKLRDRLGYEFIHLPAKVMEEVSLHVNKLWEALGPIDYFRVDYRYSHDSGQLRMLEINICCHFEEASAIALAASHEGISYEALLAHVIAYSLQRQAVQRKHFKWVL